MPKPLQTLAALLALHLSAALTPPLHAAPPQAAPDVTLDQAITTAEAIFTTSCDPDQSPPIRIIRDLYKLDSPLGELALDQGLYTHWQQITQNHKANGTTPTARQDIVFAHMPKVLGTGSVSMRSNSTTAIITHYPLTNGTFSIQGKRYTMEDLALLLTAKE